MLKLLILAVYMVVLYTSAYLFLVLWESDTVNSEVEHRDEWPSLTVVIPAYNEEESIANTIESVLAADYPGKKDLAVVNDGSIDDTGEIASQYEDRGVKVISQENQGKGAALNRGLQEASGELFAVVDADSILKEDSLKNIVSRMDDDTAAVASAMKVYRPESLLERIQMVEYVVNVFARKLFERINSVHVTPGPLAIYRTDKIREIGGFDTESRVEDQEICFRLQERHEKLKHARDGEVYTIVPQTLKEYYRQRKRWYAGTFETIIQYRKMLLNPGYGDFGMFVMPSKVVNPLVSIFGLFIILFTLVRPVFSFLLDFTKLGWEVFNFQLVLTPAALSNILKWQVLGIDYTFLTMLGMLAIFSLSLVYMATIHVGERLRNIGILPAIIYVFWFFIIVGIMSLVSAVTVLHNHFMGGDIEW